MPAVPRLADRRDHLVVCGDDALAARVIEELTTTYGEDVTVPKSTLCALAMTQDPASPPGPSRRSRHAGPGAAVQRAGGAVDWSPARTLRLAAQDRLYVIATRAGLSRVLAGSQAPRGPIHSP